MKDLALNSDFSVTLDDRNDLRTVEGRDAFEQSVAIYLQEFLYSASPDFLQRETAEEKLRLEVTRVARDHNELDSIEAIEVERDGVRDGAFLVTVTYTSQQQFDLEVEA